MHLAVNIGGIRPPVLREGIEGALILFLFGSARARTPRGLLLNRRFSRRHVRPSQVSHLSEPLARWTQPIEAAEKTHVLYQGTTLVGP
jgi:hypothetical protein